jgi:hypothetical protein
VVITPWVDEPEDPEKEELLDNEHHNKYRSLIARRNFMAHDRMDMQFTSKECARKMSSPNLRDWGRLKRSGRYLEGAPTVVMHYPFQDLPSTLVGYSVANWAGDKQKRKSTSGGVVMFGAHYIKSWSKTQSTVALSSAESEFYGLVKCVVEVLGIKSAIERWGVEIKGVIKSDASAALGIIQRQGLGKMRHLDCSYLYIQQVSAERILRFEKVPGANNPADLCAKGLASEKIKEHMAYINAYFLAGRADVASRLCGSN